MLSIIHCLEGYDKVQNAHTTFLTFSCAFDVNTSEFQTTFSKSPMYIGPLTDPLSCACMDGYVIFLQKLYPKRNRSVMRRMGRTLLKHFWVKQQQKKTLIFFWASRYVREECYPPSSTFFGDLLMIKIVPASYEIALYSILVRIFPICVSCKYP